MYKPAGPEPFINVQVHGGRTIYKHAGPTGSEPFTDMEIKRTKPRTNMQVKGETRNTFKHAGQVVPRTSYKHVAVR